MCVLNLKLDTTKEKVLKSSSCEYAKLGNNY